MGDAIEGRESETVARMTTPPIMGQDRRDILDESCIGDLGALDRQAERADVDGEAPPTPPLIHAEARLTSPSRRNVLLVDLDGTLTDPAEGIVGCFRFALGVMGRAAPPAGDLAWIIGPPLRQSFAKVLGGMADAEEALAIYRTRYGAKGLFEAVVYDGVPEALSRLNQSGAQLFLCTSKPSIYANRILAHFDLGRYFKEAYGSALDGRLEDKGDLIAHILAARALDSRDCVMWGDRSTMSPARSGIMQFRPSAHCGATAASENCATLAPRRSAHGLPKFQARSNRFTRAEAHARTASHDPYRQVSPPARPRRRAPMFAHRRARRTE